MQGPTKSSRPKIQMVKKKEKILIEHFLRARGLRPGKILKINFSRERGTWGFGFGGSAIFSAGAAALETTSFPHHHG